MRALMFDWPHDERIWDFPLQYLLGDELLVAPVTSEGASTWRVYLPAGDWVDVWTGKAVTGNAVLTRDVPIDVIPVYCRAAAWDSLALAFNPGMVSSGGRRDARRTPRPGDGRVSRGGSIDRLTGRYDRAVASLRVFVCTPLPEELCQLIEIREPRIHLIRDQELLPPQQHPGDHIGDPGFARTPEQEAAFRAHIDAAEALYGAPEQSGPSLARAVRANPRLRWVHLTPAGGGGQVRAARLSAAELARVVFTTSAGVHAEPLSEFAVFGVLAGAKELTWLQSMQRARVWGQRHAVPQVSGARVLVVGLGGIGRAVARKLAALGAHVVGVHRRQVEAAGVREIVLVSDLAAQVAGADAMVLCLPETDATRHLVSRDVLAAVKRGMTLVNVGRGSTVDQDALIEAIRDGRIGFAALDVFAEEPLAADSPLWGFHNVIISPHNAAFHLAEERNIAELFAANAGRLLEGLPLVNVVNTVEFY
jgi:phosphoglycerate dehydrogenase-like enzyme